MKIRRRIMPGTKLELSVIALGSVPFGGDVSEDQSFRLLDEYAELGGNFIDSAEVYSNWLPGEPSRAETRVGRWLKTRGMTKEMFVATKGGHPRMTTMHISRLSRREILDDIAGSLDRLGLDRLPLYLLHRDNPAQPVNEMVETLAEAVAAGLVQHSGCSNWRAERIAAAQQLAAQHGWPQFVADQMRWSLANVNAASQPDPTLVEMDAPLYEYHCATGLAAMPYSSQAQGFFSADYGRHIPVPATRSGAKIVKYYYNEANFARHERVLKLARHYGRPPTHIALGYLLNQPFAVFPIIGCSSVEHVRDSAAAHDIELPPEEVCWLDTGK